MSSSRSAGFFARLAVALCLTLACAGCAQSAVLELQLMLPMQAGSARFARVQVRRAEGHPFELEWLGQDVEAIELGAEPSRAQISVVSPDSQTDVHIKVRFCVSPSCDAFEDDMAPELWYRVERPFYLGRRTSWATCIDAIPTALPLTPIEVGRCEVRGCARSAGSTTNCGSMGTGAHFCETGSQDEPPRDLRCVGGVADY